MAGRREDIRAGEPLADEPKDKEHLGARPEDAPTSSLNTPSREASAEPPQPQRWLPIGGAHAASQRLAKSVVQVARRSRMNAMRATGMEPAPRLYTRELYDVLSWYTTRQPPDPVEDARVLSAASSAARWLYDSTGYPEPPPFPSDSTPRANLASLGRWCASMQPHDPVRKSWDTDEWDRLLELVRRTASLGPAPEAHAHQEQAEGPAQGGLRTMRAPQVDADGERARSLASHAEELSAHHEEDTGQSEAADTPIPLTPPQSSMPDLSSVLAGLLGEDEVTLREFKAAIVNAVGERRASKFPHSERVLRETFNKAEVPSKKSGKHRLWQKDAAVHAYRIRYGRPTTVHDPE